MVPVRRPWPQESHATDQEQCTTCGLHASGICEISAPVVRRPTGVPHVYGHGPQLARRANRSETPTTPSIGTGQSESAVGVDSTRTVRELITKLRVKFTDS